jgi:hypothetical protein
MPEADQSYLSENSPAMTRRQLFMAALIAVIMPKPPLVEPPFPPTCEGMRLEYDDMCAPTCQPSPGYKHPFLLRE